MEDHRRGNWRTCFILTLCCRVFPIENINDISCRQNVNSSSLFRGPVLKHYYLVKICHSIKLLFTLNLPWNYNFSSWSFDMFSSIPFETEDADSRNIHLNLHAHYKEIHFHQSGKTNWDPDVLFLPTWFRYGLKMKNKALYLNITNIIFAKKKH